jgi:SOS response regulatory protein OraA/RecX
MGISEEIEEMQKEGRSENEIRSALVEDGVSPQRIEEILSEMRIKAAVNDNVPVANPQSSPQPSHSTQEMAANQESYDRGDFTPSMFNTQEEMQQQAAPQAYDQQYQDPNAQYAPQYQDPYQNQYSTGLSSDTISEISEQVFTEKIGSLKKEVEKISDLRTTVIAKIDYLDDRLKRIEKVIDRLQLSVLQKVGEYVTNVEDLKKEVVETQKSFKALHSRK